MTEWSQRLRLLARTSPMDEYESLHDLDRVSQGDVIEWVDGHRERPWNTFGVVVTADCDLVWGKHKGYISYVPAWTTEDFIWHRLRAEILVGPAERHFDKLAKRLSAWVTRRGGDLTLSGEVARVWLKRVGPEQLLDELGVADRGERNSLLNVIEPARAVDEALDRRDPDMALLARAYGHVDKGAPDGWSALAREVARHWRTLPGDVFHLPSLPDGEDGDLFLLLRHIRQIGPDELTARPADVRFGSAKAKRVARVSAPFRYAITQNLGKVFADIGLPDDYDERRSVAAERYFRGRTKV